MSYPETCTWYGALTFAQLTGDKHLAAKLGGRLDKLIANDPKGLAPVSAHVDPSIAGAVPLELFIQTGSPKYLELGRQYADFQWEHPTPEGLSGQTRFWIDDMYMITLLQVEAYRATGELKYVNRAAKEMVVYLDKLQQPNGLFYHAPDAQFFWGRGNGWVAAGMTELLSSLPRNNPDRPRIMASYRKMMAALVQYQSAEGTWSQLIDRPDSWPETSSSGMFTFAMITGVKKKWLDKKYADVARKGWLGLVSHIDAKGQVKNVCEGTNKKNDLQYYLDRARKTGDLHGQAPILWCASALLR